MTQPEIVSLMKTFLKIREVQLSLASFQQENITPKSNSEIYKGIQTLQAML